jgi:antitoxin component YwqK of YwqJK toxin-antitoxin module
MSNRKLAWLVFLFLPFQIFAQVRYTCGQKEIKKRPYGTIELRVRCDFKEDNILSILEYKGKVQHGFQIDYDSLWRKRDSLFFKNGKKQGNIIHWDTLGNVIGRATYKNGEFVGTREYYFEPGRPSMIKHYNAEGKEEGTWKEWWMNGNPKADLIAKNGQIVSGTEFYPNGNPRLRFEVIPLPRSESVFKRKHVRGEAWTPTGKSTGRIVNGNGEWTLFSAVPDDSVSKRYLHVFREVYKDSLMVKGEKLDSAEVAKWLASPPDPLSTPIEITPSP